MRTMNTIVVLLAIAGAGRAQIPAAYFGRPESNLLSVIAVGKATSYENLTLFPLTGPASGYASYRLLDEAIRSGQVEVQEKDGGEVNTVRMQNTGKTYVFGMAGEIVSGAKQDRMLQDDMLLPPGSGWLDVPVYCTEHGRWTGSSLNFGTKGYVASGGVRERAAKTQSQQEVWDAVDAAHAQLKVATPSRAFAKVYEDKDAQEQAKPYLDKLEGLPAAFPCAIGVAVAVGNKLVCVDAFGSPELFRKMWPKLLRSYVIDAMQSQAHGAMTAKQVQQLIRSAAGAQVSNQPTVGAGTLQRLSAVSASGSTLVFKRTVVHLDLFPDSNPVREDGPAPRLDVRRQRTLE